MDTLSSLWDAFAESVLKVLPLSPFRQYLTYFAGWEYLGWLNWFFPFKAIFAILRTWLTAVGVYYGWSVVLRWIKIIGD